MEYEYQTIYSTLKWYFYKFKGTQQGNSPLMATPTCTTHNICFPYHSISGKSGDEGSFSYVFFFLSAYFNSAFFVRLYCMINFPLQVFWMLNVNAFTHKIQWQKLNFSPQTRNCRCSANLDTWEDGGWWKSHSISTAPAVPVPLLSSRFLYPVLSGIQVCTATAVPRL